MGVVHLAWDPMLQRPVALKRLIHADPLQTIRFMREAQLQAKVEHPHICKVFEVDSEDGHPFIAMQYLQGTTLGEARERLGLREKVRLMAEVAAALHAAHRSGLVHRDLKPSNILLEPQEDGSCRPCIVDFGLARDQSQADLTLSWGLVGTPAFMSPEQGQGREATRASDLYSLGATFYAVFGGHPPHEATTLAGLLKQQATRDVCLLRRMIPGFPKDLDTILETCLHPDPDRRYSSAFALEEDLRRWLAEEPIQARPISRWERIWRAVMRHRRLSLAIATGLAASLSLVTWNIATSRRARTHLELAQRFSLQIREVEQLMRIERMLPAHDIRPAEARIRQRMAEIRAAMTTLGAPAHGPGHYALGRGHFALGEAPAAQEELKAAIAHGFDTPEVEYTLASAILDHYIRVRDTNPTLGEAKHVALRQRMVSEALAHFRNSVASLQEEAAFGDAQIAFLEGDYSRCIEKSREAFRQRPWQYEAKMFEAWAWIGLSSKSLGMTDTPLRSEAQGQAALAASKQAMDAARALAPSDERLVSLEIHRIISMSIFQSDSGNPSEAIFRESEAMHERALRIRPGNIPVLAAWVYSRIRLGFVLLREGKDPRPLMQETLADLQPQEAAIRDHNQGHNVAWVYWILADGRWRHGESPLPDLARMDAWVVTPAHDLAQPLAIGAEYLASHGKDPGPVLGRAIRLLEEASPIQKENNYYHHVIWGHVLLVKAEWLGDRGLDPLPVLDSGIAHQEVAIRLSPRSVYPRFFKAQFHTRRALALLARSQDPGPDLAKALASARAGQAITASHHRVFLALGETHHAQALHLARQGLDPAKALQEARVALATGLKINSTDFRLHREAANVELSEGRHAAASGASPLEALARAEQLARKGAGIKGDDPHLWLTLAQAQRLRAEWHIAHGEPAERLAQESRQCLARALALHPALEAARAERAAQASPQENPPWTLPRRGLSERWLGPRKRRPGGPPFPF